MHEMTSRQRTATATIFLVRPGLIEQRYHDDAQFSEEAVNENQNLIDALSGGAPYLLLNIFPAGMRVSLPMMDKDHFRDHRARNLPRALAVVTDSAEMHTAAKLYFLYHQQPFETKVFGDEQEAIAWLNAFAG